MGPLASEAAGRARAVVLFGEARSEFADALAGSSVPVIGCECLDAAVREAASIAMPGDSVLLSPGCASFDEFANYEERGRAFKKAVERLAEWESVR